MTMMLFGGQMSYKNNMHVHLSANGNNNWQFIAEKLMNSLMKEEAKNLTNLYFKPSPYRGTWINHRGV